MLKISIKEETNIKGRYIVEKNGKDYRTRIL
jgi:hypothetical protein